MLLLTWNWPGLWPGPEIDNALWGVEVWGRIIKICVFLKEGFPYYLFFYQEISQCSKSKQIVQTKKFLSPGSNLLGFGFWPKLFVRDEKWDYILFYVFPQSFLI